MKTMLLRAGQSIGLLLMAVAVVARMAGHFILGGFATGTLMLAGIGAVGAGCFLLLMLLVGRDQR